MYHWVLVVYIYAGFMAKGDSVTLQTIAGFSSQEVCQEAGRNLEHLTANSTKELRYECVETK